VPALLWILEKVIFPACPARTFTFTRSPARWIGLLATAWNLLPIGQLDGGHVVYSLVRSRTNC